MSWFGTDRRVSQIDDRVGSSVVRNECRTRNMYLISYLLQNQGTCVTCHCYSQHCSVTSLTAIQNWKSLFTRKLEVLAQSSQHESTLVTCSHGHQHSTGKNLATSSSRPMTWRVIELISLYLFVCLFSFSPTWIHIIFYLIYDGTHLKAYVLFWNVENVHGWWFSFLFFHKKFFCLEL